MKKHALRISLAFMAVIFLCISEQVSLGSLNSEESLASSVIELAKRPSQSEGTGKECKDGIDNDLDGLTDCDDPDCKFNGPGFCGFEGTEITKRECSDGIDNDLDELIDCDDPSCSKGWCK